MIVVATDGNDRNSGTKAHPFQSIERALEKARAANPGGQRMTTTIVLGPGCHRLTAPLRLGPDLTGPDKTLIIRAATGAHVELTGSTTLTGARPLACADELPISTEARGQIWEIPVPDTCNPRQFHIDNTPQTLAMWPKMDDWESWPVCEPGAGERRLRIPEIARKRHSNPADIRINILSTPFTHWINYIGTIATCDEENIEVSIPLTPNRYLQPAPRIPFRFENALEALTAPGEWCLDTAARCIYFWPPAGTDPAHAMFTVPRLACLIRIEGTEENPVRGIRLQGLLFTGTAAPDGADQAALELHHAMDCEIRNCRFNTIGGTAVRASGTMRRNRITGCRISNCGGNGIVIQAPNPSRKRCSENNVIAHNHISRCGRVNWNGRGISLAGSSQNRICDNLIEDMPYAAISVGGARLIFTLTETTRTLSPDCLKLADIASEERTVHAFKRYVGGGNIIEDNTIRDVMKQLDDGGAIYCHASHHNIVRRNQVCRAVRNRSHGLYFDDDETDSLMEENTVVDCPAQDGPGGSAIHVHDNANNTVRRNCIIGTCRAFTFPCAYGGHTCVGNVFVLRPGARHPVPPGHDAGRYQEIHWDAGLSYLDDNIYWSTDNGATARATLEWLQAQGFDRHSRVKDPGAMTNQPHRSRQD